MFNRIEQILHALSHAPVEFPLIVSNCYIDNCSLVAYGHSVYKVNNALIAGVGLQVATEIAKHAEKI